MEVINAQICVELINEVVTITHKHHLLLNVLNSIGVDRQHIKLMQCLHSIWMLVLVPEIALTILFPGTVASEDVSSYITAATWGTQEKLLDPFQTCPTLTIVAI